ncbi:MAG: domain containing protein [Deltaproteobacteria bacterium]|nr:domain containing protein [Deltaproteobacteria bacterium]
MKFCRSCGSALAGAPPSQVPVAATLMQDTPAAIRQIVASNMPPAGPIEGNPAGAPVGGRSPGAIGGASPGARPAMPAAGPMPMAGAFASPGSFGPSPGMAPPPPTLPPAGATPFVGVPKAPPAPAPQANTVTCPRCSTATPIGFAYCQQCGLHMQAVQPTDPGQPARSHPISAPPPMAARPPAQQPPAQQPPIDVQAATIAAGDARAGIAPGPQASRPPPQTGTAWGTAVLVNRDGSDGQRYPLTGEYLVVGRAGSDIEFADDRFLARQHARLERANDGAVKVVPVDTLNGVYRKADAPVELVDGMTILVGREVLRFERVEPEETKVHPLVRHGVALFGSPPREPWGRLIAIVPSGGHRDVRHLVEKETVLGREEGDIVFRDDAFMSRRHAAVTWDGKRAQITDLGSSNGTFVRVTGPTPLKHGDHVRMGDQLLRIELGK